MLKILLLIIIFLIGGFLRRWLGGGFPKLSKHRIVAMFFWFLLGFNILLIKNLVYKNYLISLIFWYLIWWGHGGFFTIIDERKRERKNKIISYIIDKIFKNKNFSILANYIGLTIGYVFHCFLVSVCIKNLLFSLVGILISTTYLICGLIWKWYYKSIDRYIKKLEEGKKVWDYTKLSEFIVGGIVAICYYLCL